MGIGCVVYLYLYVELVQFFVYELHTAVVCVA